MYVFILFLVFKRPQVVWNSLKEFTYVKYCTSWLFCDDLLLAMPHMAVRLMCKNEDKLITLMDMEHLSK